MLKPAGGLAARIRGIQLGSRVTQRASLGSLPAVAIIRKSIRA
jgi:hypothetical protein